MTQPPNVRVLTESNAGAQATDKAKPLGAALDALFISPDVFHDPTGETGTLTTLDSGHAVTNFGNAPLTRLGGFLQHTPYAGANSAGYLQAQLSGNVRRISAEVNWPAGANGSIDLVVSPAPWTDTPSPVRPAAGIHFVIYGNGQWHVSNWTGSGELMYASDVLNNARLADMRDGITRTVEIFINPDKARATIIMPDGRAVNITGAAIGTLAGPYAIWELYESDGTTTTPGKIGRIWADSRTPVAGQRIPTLGEAARVVASTPPNLAGMLPVATQLFGTTPVAVEVPISFTDIDAATAIQAFTAPPSGKVRIDLQGYVDMTAAASVWWQITSLSGTAWGTQRVINNKSENGHQRASFIVSALPAGSAQTVKWQHLSTVAAAATWRHSSASGYRAMLSVTPLA